MQNASPTIQLLENCKIQAAKVKQTSAYLPLSQIHLSNKELRSHNFIINQELPASLWNSITAAAVEICLTLKKILYWNGWGVGASSLELSHCAALCQLTLPLSTPPKSLGWLERVVTGLKEGFGSAHTFFYQWKLFRWNVTVPNIVSL